MATEPNRVVLEILRITRVGWTSWNDAVGYVQHTRGIDRDGARAELTAAIGAGQLPVRWLDQDGDADKPPGHPKFWSEASIRDDHGGEVLHQVIDLMLIDDGLGARPERRISPPTYRALLVDRASLLALWQPPSVQDERPEAASLPVKRASVEKILEVARQVYQACGDDPPNMARAERLIRQRLPGATRGPIRKVLQQPEFATKRRPSGVRRAR